MKLPSRPEGRRLSDRELEFVVRQLAALLQAGIPLERALGTLAAQAKPRAAEMLTALRDRLREGASLSRSMAAYERDFSESFRGLVAVGEGSGSLAVVLERMADSMADANRLRQGLVSAMAYPFIVTLVALMVVFALMTYVVPQIVTVLAAQNQALPLLTRALMAVSGFLQAYGTALLLGLLAVTAAASVAISRSAALRLATDRLLLQIPLLGPMLRAHESSRLASTLALSLSGGVSLLKALGTASRVVRNRDLRARLTQAASDVREGAELGRALTQQGGFPALLTQLISTGERSGELPKMLELAADQLSQDLRQKTSLLTTILEPALILGMGLIVLLIVLAVMMPLIEMNTLLR
ncbi:MAG: hypothetical protein RLY30_270 [Pseudomonadota bacterium]|jgi:general secretion pathway protein F